MHQIVDVNGSFADPVPVFFGAFAAGNTGGLFAQGTNIGRQSRDVFAVIPEVQFNIGIDITRGLRVFAGYDAMFLSSVVRPGDQVDRSVNLTQAGAGAPFNSYNAPPVVGQASPAPQFNQSSFWAHGVNFGIQLTY
jgi:hypothetical protein